MRAIGSCWRRVPISPYRSYEVSDCGQVRRGTRVLRTAKDRYGYQRIGLYYAGLRRRFTLHRLVCETYHGPAPSPAHEVCHIDGDKTNNSPSNLRWGTRKENTADSVKHGTFFNAPAVAGEGHPCAKLRAEQVAELRAMRERGLSQRALARRFGISQTQVCHILQGKQWTGRACSTSRRFALQSTIARSFA